MLRGLVLKGRWAEAETFIKALEATNHGDHDMVRSAPLFLREFDNSLCFSVFKRRFHCLFALFSRAETECRTFSTYARLLKHADCLHIAEYVYDSQALFAIRKQKFLELLEREEERPELNQLVQVCGMWLSCILLCLCHVFILA